MRTYLDACGVTRALDIVGDRWALPVVRELVFGPRRYSDLATALPGVSSNILGARLVSLVEDGVVRKRRLPAPAATVVYELTRWGASLEPALLELGRWAAHAPVDMEKQAFSASSLALSLKVTFNPERSVGVWAHACLVMGEDIFDVRIENCALSVRRADNGRAIGADGANVVHVRGLPKVLAALIYQADDIVEENNSDLVRIEGPRETLQAFIRSFTLPRPPEDTL